MADITVTAKQVSPLPGAIVRNLVAAGTGSVGDAVYIDGNGKAAQADGDAGSGAEKARGIVVSAGTEGAVTFAAGDMLSVVFFGPVSGFASMTPNALHYISDTAGAVADAAGTNSHIIGFALSDTVLFVQPQLA
jgi:hypothetical protein